MLETTNEIREIVGTLTNRNNDGFKWWIENWTDRKTVDKNLRKNN